jgi:hypothetical protein
MQWRAAAPCVPPGRRNSQVSPQDPGSSTT